jgi:3-deoxy-D-manno-octulosonic-acid transferase
MSLLFWNRKIKLDRTIWFHAASLGGYEQGLPVIENEKNILYTKL